MADATTRKAAPRNKGAAKPAQRKPTAKELAAAKAPGGSAAAAAIDETNPQVKTVEFRGLTLTLPEELPATIGFDFIELENEAGAMPLLRLLRSLLGKDQFIAVRNAMDGADDVFGVVDGLFADIFEQYGMDQGK